jgi:hypothetical protein
MLNFLPSTRDRLIRRRRHNRYLFWGVEHAPLLQTNNSSFITSTLDTCTSRGCVNEWE